MVSIPVTRSSGWRAPGARSVRWGSPASLRIVARTVIWRGRTSVSVAVVAWTRGGTSGSVVPSGGVSVVPVRTISRVRSRRMVFVVI